MSINEAIEPPQKLPGAGDAAAVEPRPRILVVDDVFDNRDILTRRLVRRGFDVVEAAGGHEALARLQEQDFDLVLLDIMMPDMCGNDVLRTIRQTRSSQELPVIMVTAKSQSQDVVESLDIGANDYVTKPVDFAVALARINSHLERKRRAEADLRLKLETCSAEARAREAEKRRATEQRLQHLAYHDNLTGLLNRLAFREMLSQTIEDPEKVALDPALLFVDLDRFKAVNDVYGHEVGDRLIAEAASRLRAVVGEDAQIARLGGDEFGILLPAPGSPDDGARLAERLVEAVCQPFVIDGQHLQIGGSCGLALASDCEGRLDTLVKAADLAMYCAKLAGRNRFVRYHPSMLEEKKARSALEVALRRAIYDEALEVVYQPLINSATRKVTAFEALVRWNHPQLGLLLPEKFIPVAEETGLIVPLGSLVLRQACHEATRWPADIRVAVNLSPLQFRNHELIPTIEQILKTSKLDPSRLELEITESALLEAGSHTLEILRQIRALGIRVSMDDFGTGYSSIGYLQNFEFDKIKIDRRFVHGLRPGQNGGAIVKAIADLGAGVGVELTAEGVETSEEMRAVASYGCTEIQGFLFSRPLTPDDARAFIEQARDGLPEPPPG